MQGEIDRREQLRLWHCRKEKREKERGEKYPASFERLTFEKWPSKTLKKAHYEARLSSAGFTSRAKRREEGRKKSKNF